MSEARITVGVEAEGTPLPRGFSKLGEKWRWRLNRLTCMSAREIAYRVQQSVSNQWERLGSHRACPVPAADLARQPAAPWVSDGAGIAPGSYIAAAERVVAGRVDIFALKNVYLGDPPAWNRNLQSGIDAPLDFGKTLDYRATGISGQIGSIKYLWEPNRHLHIVTLAQAWRISGDERYLRVIQRHLDSWFTACPYRMGPNWSSSLEPAMRLINWSVAWQLLGGADGPVFAGPGGADFRARWLEMIYLHAEFVLGYLSLHSSANNHLLGEAAGIFTAGLSWPHWERAATWMDTGREILEREIRLQNAPDGVNREQAVAYQRFALDLLLVCGLAARAAGRDFSPGYWAIIEAMLVYLASITDVAGNVPMIGDADDASVVAFSQEAGFCPNRSLLATGAVLFGSAWFKMKAGVLDDKTRWMLGVGTARIYDALALPISPPSPPRDFAEGGYFVLGMDFEQPDEIRIVADAGPLGYLGIAAHGHADALAFTLSVGGREFLIDPGTYCYHSEAQWRSYFKSTAAHNTVCVDGLDQSESGGSFMWMRKANAYRSQWLSCSDADRLECWHDGYARLADPVIHHRTLHLDKRRRCLLIEDVLECAGVHEVEISWNFSEHCQVALDGHRAVVTHGGRVLHFTLPAGPEVAARVVCGGETPIRGWISRRFDEKTPSPAIVCAARIHGRRLFRTEIAL